MKNKATRDEMSKYFVAHPWHGIPIGEEAPSTINVFVEVVPQDDIKYEIDKDTGHLWVDRPQKFSNRFPALYGFAPRTFCQDEVAAFSREKVGRQDIDGDEDPLDVCIVTEREITHGNIVVPCHPIGGYRMLDGGEADDKIIAVMKGDKLYEQYKDAHELPQEILDRLKHYFLSYKEIPQKENTPKIEITHLYGREEAYEVIRRSMKDYDKNYRD